MDAPAFKIIPQQSRADCAVACLAMLLGLSYTDVLVQFDHNVSAHGASGYQIKAVARKLGKRLKWQATADLENDTGILMVGSKGWPLHHLVILKEGQIVDTDSTLWDSDVFMSVHKAESMGIFTLREAK